MKLLDPSNTLVETPIDSSSNSQCATDDSTHARQKAREGLRPRLAVDDLHRGDVVVDEDARDAGRSVETLLVALVGGVAAHEGALVRRHGVLVRFDAAGGAVAEAVGAERGAVEVVVHGGGEQRVPPEREVRGRHDLHEVHVVEGGLGRLLLGVVERVRVVVVCPLPAGGERVGELGPEAQLVDLVRHGVLFGVREAGFEVVLEIVHVDVAVCEAAAWGDVEVADDFVDAHDAFETAAFAPLGVDALRVAFPLALLDVLAFAEGPLVLGVGGAHFFARVAAAFLAFGHGDAAAFAAVVGVEVFGFFLLRMTYVLS